jgi:hypothetical protein
MPKRDLTVPANSVDLINDKLGLLSDITQNLSETGKLAATAIDGAIAEASGGTGESTFADGQLLIGNGTTKGLNKANLTAGSASVTITNGPGTIAIDVTAGSGLGNVIGPASATANAIAVYNGTTGKIIKDSLKLTPGGVIVGDTDSQTLTNKTLTTPTIGDFSNATHGHQNAAGGGTLDAAAVATGQLALARGGSGADLSATGGTHQVLRQSTLGGAVTVSQLAASDVSGLAASATTDTTNASNISSGTLPAGRMPALTGDITTSAGAVATTLATVNSGSGTTGDASHVAQVTTNAKGLVTAQSSVAISITPTAAGLSNVTNDAQTKAAVVPNTAPSAGQILVGNAGGTAYAPQTMGTDATLASTGALTIANSAVTLAKMANMATSSLIYRKTAGSGAPEVNTLATLKTDLLLTGTNSGDQTISLVGDVTGSGTGSFTATLANIPTAVPAAGTIVHANIAAPSSPAAGKVAVYSDSTDLRFHDKNASGVIGTTVVADTGASNNFLTAISAAGAISKAQPAFSNLSGSVAASQMPALTGDVTTSAGAVATTIGSGKVTNAMLAGSIAASKLTGTDIATVGTITAGTWTGTTIAVANGGTGLTTTAWITPAYAGGNFTGNGSMTWTVDSGDVTTNAYIQIGKLITYSIYLVNTSVGGTPNTALQIVIPSSQTAKKTMMSLCRISDSGAAFTPGLISVTASGSVIQITKMDGSSNWSASTNATLIMGQLTFEVN